MLGRRVFNFGATAYGTGATCGITRRSTSRFRF
jgi:hypothetical protein